MGTRGKVNEGENTQVATGLLSGIAASKFS